VDADGDVVMTDTETDGERSVGFDGHSTLLQKIPRALHVDHDEYVESVNISSGEAGMTRMGILLCLMQRTRGRLVGQVRIR
jgi:hypothetical protein